MKKKITVKYYKIMYAECLADLTNPEVINEYEIWGIRSDGFERILHARNNETIWKKIDFTWHDPIKEGYTPFYKWAKDCFIKRACKQMTKEEAFLEML